MIAKNAGMRYVVITSKHHDGFCLWPSEYTDFDVEGTPFKRDIMGELAEACRNEGLVFCMYYSIMDWTHPDYLPRRAWDDRPVDNVDYERYVAYMNNQLGELVENYGPGVLWFDGEWEGTWTHEHGQEMYDYVRTLDPRIVVNNRVDTGRTGMAGLTREGGYRGDFGTPEQQIPSTGFPQGVDWETCMTMNRSWGYQSFDTAFKTTKELIQKLVDIASKGGNFLLNVGPDSRGRFPQDSVDRLNRIGRWMDANGESIHGTFASPFPALPWGRCTRRTLPNGNQRLYLHVFEPPENRKLVLPGLMNQPISKGAYILSDPGRADYMVQREGASLVISLPDRIDNEFDTVFVLDIEGEAIVVGPPQIMPSSGSIFIDSIQITLESPSDDVTIRYQINGEELTESSPRYTTPLNVSRSTNIKAACFLDGKIVSEIAEASFEQVQPRRAVHLLIKRPGLMLRSYEGEFDALPDFSSLTSGPTVTVEKIDLSTKPRDENFAMLFTGFIEVPESGIYTFYLDSDDGSRFLVGNEVLIDNDGLHSAIEKSGAIALAKGLHPIAIEYFEKTGQDDLILQWSGPSFEKQPVESVLFH